MIRDAMAAEDMVGISRLVISRRERAVMLEPRGKGIVVWTLRYGDEVRDEDAYFVEIDDPKSDSKVMPLVQQLIKKQTRHWDSKLVADPVQDRLLEIIEAKRKKTKRPVKAKASNRRLRPIMSSISWMRCAGRSRLRSDRASANWDRDIGGNNRRFIALGILVQAIKDIESELIGLSPLASAHGHSLGGQHAAQQHSDALGDFVCATISATTSHMTTTCARSARRAFQYAGRAPRRTLSRAMIYGRPICAGHSPDRRRP